MNKEIELYLYMYIVSHYLEQIDNNHLFSCKHGNTNLRNGLVQECVLPRSRLVVL